MATIEIIARNASYNTVRAYRVRTFKNTVNALCRVGTLVTDGTIDRALTGADNVLVIVRDENGYARYRHMYR